MLGELERYIVVTENTPTRAEFDRLNREFGKLAERQAAAQQELAIQFQRIAALQAEIDVIRAAWAKMRPKAKRKTASRKRQRDTA